MRVQAFLARPEELPRLVAGEAPGVPLTGVDPLNLSSLAEIVSGGEVPSTSAIEILRHPVISAGPLGPSIFEVPAEITRALANSDDRERARWISGWTAGTGAPRGQALASVAELAARREPNQSLYVWVGP